MKSSLSYLCINLLLFYYIEIPSTNRSWKWKKKNRHEITNRKHNKTSSNNSIIKLQRVWLLYAGDTIGALTNLQHRKLNASITGKRTLREFSLFQCTTASVVVLSLYLWDFVRCYPFINALLDLKYMSKICKVNQV